MRRRMFECGIAKSSPRSSSWGRAATALYLRPRMPLAVVGVWLCLGVGVFGQGSEGGTRYQLPSTCLAKYGPGASNGALSAIAQAIHHRALKEAQAPSADVVFACSIIVRDLAAIDLARQELRDGKDLATKAVAKSLLDSARTEIVTLTGRLNVPSI
jgi:hypothetical protein